jgi:PleD family two-component response regulator
MTHTTQAPTQKVVVVNGSTEALGVLESLLDAGHYDMVFVAASDRAYSTIRRELPNLVVLCTTIESLDGVQLLTLLRLDQATKDIPVLSYTCEDQTQDFDAAISDIADERLGQTLRPARPVARMN